MKLLSRESLLLLLLVAPICTVHAKNNNVNCDKKSLQSEIDKLEKDDINVLRISGTCTEDIVVSGYRDVALIGNAGASISATVFDSNDYENSTIALKVLNSKVTIDSLTINSGQDGVACSARSTCTIRNSIIQGGWGGVGFQDQSAGDILGATIIRDSLGTGLAIFGASTVNMRAEPRGQGLPAPVISGHGDSFGSGGGVLMLDGSFLRTDDVTISGNDFGVFAARDSNIKLLGVDGEVSGSIFDGVIVTQGSTAQIQSPILNNAGTGISVGELTFARIFSNFSGNGSDVDCGHPTAISSPAALCGN